ncbi:MAG: DUF547 domain-containing protein [Proteobacteria bacterium]|nr:DUF547 domain-containing protein [Pseudomonadota bacterium]NIS67770.1 DUF547 domain-containing protein [Pseudomonadota bacterium]
MAREDLILNSETASGREPSENIDIALRKAIADLQANFFDLDEGRINYGAVRGTSQFNSYVRLAGFLKKYDLKSLRDRNQRLAFWINLYNTMVVHGVVGLGIKQSVKETRGFFNRVKYDIGGYLFSLNDVEHGILRGNRRIPHRPWRAFNRDDPRCDFIISPMDVRIHFTLVCGSQSCPPIGFYSADGIEEQLELATQTFINSKEVEIIPEGKILRISRIFKWYRPDFGRRDDLVQFLIRYLDAGEKKEFLQNNANRIRIRYNHYDWSLNH